MSEKASMVNASEKLAEEFSVYQSPEQPKEEPPENDSGIWSMLAVGLAILALLGTAYNYWQSNRQSMASANVVVFDFDGIGEALVDQPMSKAQELQNVLQTMTADGVVVLNKRTVIAYPATWDITPQIIQKLGLSNVALDNTPIQSRISMDSQESGQPEMIPPAHSEADGLDATLD